MQIGLKIIIAVDDPVSRRMYSDLAAQNDVREAVTAANGRIALAKLSQDAFDLMLLDIGWPDCLETIRTVYLRHPETNVIVVETGAKDSCGMIIEALESGAIDVLPRIDQNSPGAVIQDAGQRLKILLKICFGRQSIQKTKALIRNGFEKDPLFGTVTPAASAVYPQGGCEKVNPMAIPGTPGKYVPHPSGLKFEAVVIGVSTGGPNALARVIPKLPADFGLPVLIVQHMPAYLTGHLAVNLDQKSMIRVKEATEGEELKPGTVYLAPGGKHLTVRQVKKPEEKQARKLIAFSSAPPENSCRPSVDVLLLSISESFGGHILVVIMTGMGNDGMNGVKALKEKGVYCLTQTRDTCTVYGMPRMVDEAGLSDERVPLDGMAERIVSLIQK